MPMGLPAFAQAFFASGDPLRIARAAELPDTKVRIEAGIAR